MSEPSAKPEDAAYRKMMADPTRIFSGDKSRKLWALINATPAEAGDALYALGCALQELESHVRKLQRRKL
jgi:hypothetical protein